jgi:hypothetical protein
MTFSSGVRPEGLPDDIRRQFNAPGTTRFLRAQPWLHAEPGIPPRFMELLAELDRAEGRGAETQNRYTR